MNRNPTIPIVMLGLIASTSPAQISVDSFDGPVTSNEVATFKTYINTLQPAVWPNVGDMANEYGQGHSGESIKALGLMYEITGDTAILDRMIYFCDVLLTERNDILAAPYGQHTMWTGTITPDWISSQTDPNATGNAPDGDCVGHLAYCARLILQTPSLLNVAVPEGDVYGHGMTYGQRAATFIAEGDFTYSHLLFTNILNLANGNEYYFSATSPYMTNSVVPWNQQMMFSYGLQNLAGAHAILNDNPSLVTQYDGDVQANLNWFFNSSTTKQTYTDAAGNSAYNWAYNPSGNAGEDSNHGALDVAGYYRAYLINRYGVTQAQMEPFANMYCDVMMLGPKFFAGRVDGTNGTGHGSPTSYVRSANLFLADLRPDKYYDLVGADLTAGGTTTSMDTFSRFAWAKNQRNKEGYAVAFSPAAGPFTSGQTVSLSTTLSGGSIRYTTDGSTPTTTTGTLYSAPIAVSATTVLKAIAYNGSTTSPVSTAKYTIWANAPTFSVAAGSYNNGQSVTITSTTGGATIRYTTDNTTPSQTNGTVYTGPVSIAATATLRAVAYTSSLSTSNVTSALYTIGPFVATPTFSPAAGSYGSAQTVTISTTTGGATLYYTTDGSTPTTSSAVYTGPITVSAGTTLSAIGVETGMTNSATGIANYIIGTVAAPTYSLAAGTYTGTQTLTLNSSTPGATILFTLDGSNPTTSTGMVYVYTGPVTLTKSATVQAYAYAANMNNSTVTSAAYTIALPTGWSDADIGTPPQAGSAAWSGGTFTVNGCGSDIYGTSDQFNYCSYSATGDVTITARVASQANTSSWAKSGVMIRETTAANSSYVGIYVTPSNGIDMQYRNGTGTGAYDLARSSGKAAPYWVRLVRSTNTFTGNYSADGVTWTQLGSMTITMATNVTTGLAVCSHNTGALNTTTFDNVDVSPTFVGSDIGAPPIAGSTTFNNGTYTVNGCGSDIYGTSDQFQYASDARSGNFTITARVATQQNTSSWAKSGVMIRETTAANSSYVGIYVTPSNGIDMQYRNGTGTSAYDLARSSGKAAPYWVRLVRSTNTFTGYYSADGVTWTQLGSMTVAMATNVTTGLAVCSHNTAALNTTTFDNTDVH